MEITRETLEWHPEDATHWEAFLKTQSGARLIPRLAEAAPRLLPKGDTNEVLINHGTVLGFSLAVQALLDLSLQPEAETTPVDLFPPLPEE